MRISNSTRPCASILHHNAAQSSSDKFSITDRGHLFQKIHELDKNFQKSPGIHSRISMTSAGFEYTNQGDTARCPTCQLTVSGWTLGMKPFTVHKQQRPTCSFVLSILPGQESMVTSVLHNEESPCKKLKIDTTNMNVPFNTLNEVNIIKQIRKRAFSHWPHRSSPSTSQMIDAGFFNCNVGDRVICIYCNLICQQWTPNSDDPCEVHKTLSPKCPYVIAMLIISSTSSISIINETSANVDSFQSQVITHSEVCNPNYSEIPKRHASFATWSNENSPPVDDLVRAGFFFTGTKTIVTCFYCNGSLQNWGANDNPMIEHARWFPHCAYAKQLCGVEMHRKIQESKRAQQEREKTSNADNRSALNIGKSSNGQLVIPDESTLSRFVAARLDLPISQRLLDQNFKLSVIKRCWEDQLRLKHDDFVDDCDLFMACTILQKQIEHINGQREKIIIPNVAMQRIREEAQISRLSSPPINSSNNNGVEMATSSAESDMNETRRGASSSTSTTTQNYPNNASNVDVCELCMKDEWYPVLLSCVHVHSDILSK